uniref:Uncharacterized protein n=1 Tax=Chenopodium quinoa TaxID=63459 RepID=A0A803MX61_CHEQI
MPTDVEGDKWISLVNFWRSDEGKKRSKIGKESHAKAKVKPISTTGTKSHARVREELAKINMDDDPVSKVLGKDQYGRVRSLGLGVKPSDVAEPSGPSYHKGLNMSTKDEAVVFANWKVNTKAKKAHQKPGDDYMKIEEEATIS